jgi:hypothetical protein
VIGFLQGLPARLTFAAAIVAATASASIAAITASATVSAEPATTAATTCTILARFGFVHSEASPVDFLTIELRDRSRALFVGGHLDEAEAA